MKNKIAIIIPYFGRFPEWIDLFFYSCSCNQMISDNTRVDWFIFTDNDYTPVQYNNVILKKMHFLDYCAMVSKKLDIEFHPQSPYKLCDLKPFYGIIHHDDLKGYTHWGFGDLDLCYGRLSVVLSDQRIAKYDLITTHADRVAGHLTIIRKESSYSKYCFKIKKWQDKLVNQYVYGLDEHDFTVLVYPFQPYIWRLYRYLGKPLCIKYYNFFTAINFLPNMFSKHFFQEYYTSMLPANGEKWTYDPQTSIMLGPHNIELPYLHFLFFKKNKFFNGEFFGKENFWKIENLDFKKCLQLVVFDNKKVTLSDTNKL